MKKISYLLIFLLFAIHAKSQLLSWSPSFITDTSTNVTIICDASQGNQGLLNYTPVSDVYVHIGLITSKSTSSSNWLYVPTFSTWGTANSQIQCVSLGNNKWKYTFSGSLRAFFGVTDPTEKILKIAIIFRNGAGTKQMGNIDGSDMFVPVYAEGGFFTRLDAPIRQPLYSPALVPITKVVGDNVTVTANTNQNAAISLLLNGVQVGSATNTQTASATAIITNSGTQTIVATASYGTVTSSDTSSFFIASSTAVLPLPAGDTDGINYEPGDTSCVLVVYAPFKNQVQVIGDFNNWTQSAKYQMNRTPDSLRYWIRLTGLTPGTEYAYQYVFDGSLILADYNTEKVLDKSNDPYISSATYPNLKPFPAKATGNLVSILQTAKPVYSWQATNYIRPNKNNLVIYELLVRDFTAASNYTALLDTLSYLKRLGVNAIELMPVNEFEGNSSWGYNPNFYFAPDKYYGTETALRKFIDACHQQGMAVIMDMVMNHSFGSSPMVQMYWNSALNIPAANNPWFNQYATHAYNVGFQFNHQSAATIQFTNRVINHWLTKYKIDGFRWDLAKGFTQTNTCDATGNNCNVGAWGNYDAARVATWKNIYDQMQAASSGSYCILEMFADNSEETAEANYGMMIWGNMNSNFNQATMGFSNPSWDLSYGVYTNRGYTYPNLITYQESHDEERLMYKNEQYGNVSGSYNIKDTATGLQRNGMAAAFWAMIPGPKLLWQFGELGYDYSINTCSNLTVDASGNCRTDPKPIVWNYYKNANRQALYNVYSKLLNLRNKSNYQGTFSTGNIQSNLTGAFKTLTVTSDSLSLVVVGNFDVSNQSGTVTFPIAGTWYSYLTGTTRNATGTAESITLAPGEFYVYTNRNTIGAVVTALDNIPVTDLSGLQLNISPNPVQSMATIQYVLPQSGNVNLSVLDIAGRKITDVFSGFKTKGVQSLVLDNSKLFSTQTNNGLYLLQLEINGQKKVEKFILIK